MNSSKEPLILVVDDDQDVLTLTEHFLTKNGYRVITANSGIKGLEVLSESKPDIILTDVQMPEMNGYRFCTKLQENSETAFIPVIFVTALGEEHSKAKAFSVGAVDYLVKPIDKKILLEKIGLHLKTNARWQKLRKDTPKSNVKIMAFDFIQFKEFLFNELDLPSDKRNRLATTTHSKIYSISAEIGINSQQIAQYISRFLKLPYVSHMNPEDVELGTLPAPFCRANQVVAVKQNRAELAFVLSNPFNLELIDTIDRLKKPQHKSLKLIVTQPENIESILKISATSDNVEQGADIAIKEDKDKISEIPEPERISEASQADIEKYPILSIANNILHAGVTERASDIHIEPKNNNTIVRLRVDGDMREIFTLKKRTGLMLINRFKVIGDMDIAEKHKPQDGTLEAMIDNRTFKLRLATTSTPFGESLIIRMLEPNVKPKKLGELGMTDEQSRRLVDMTDRTHGLMLIVGPTGSGKTTTIYSLLSQIDCRIRSLVSVEDPVEYHIPFANHQQVNEKTGVTFEALLKSVVRQDPDVIFLGEIRDPYSARMSIDFASTGHLTVTTLHTSNATTAIFRLERLGINRGVMADAILCVVAQRLVKKLCPHCKKISQISHEEIDMLSPFTDEIPSCVAHPVGCPRCNNTGYWGREGIYETLEFDSEVSEIVRSGAPVSEIRVLIRERGNYLISNHAVEKVKNLLFAPRDIYERVLVEETRSTKKIPEKKKQVETIADEEVDKKPSILLVDDDTEIHSLVKTILENRGYKITSAQDGIDALVSLSKEDYDLVISDINMPNLNGFKLLEIKTQKGIETPVIFLTSRTEAQDEVRGFELGAVDYIKKPIRKEILLLRIKKFLEKNK